MAKDHGDLMVRVDVLILRSAASSNWRISWSRSRARSTFPARHRAARQADEQRLCRNAQLREVWELVEKTVVAPTGFEPVFQP